MSEKKTSTPKQIPLHEVVLKVMYEVDKERPAHLTVAEVYQKISDNSISESNISEVLNWLVAQKQVERVSGKYLLDRYSFLEERAKDRGTDKKKISKKEEETPLHEVILNLMYESNKEQPAKLTLDDVFWMVSDPKVQKSLVGDVLKWLLNQRRVEYLSGKYSLDRIEFQDQEKVSEEQAAKKKAKGKPKVKKKAPEKKPEPTSKETEDTVKDKPKIIIPQAKEEPKVETALPENGEELKEKIKESAPPRPKPKKFYEELKPKEVVKEPIGGKWRMPVLVASVICVIYTLYLLFALNGSISSADGNTSSEQVQRELVSAKSKVNEISDKGTSNQNDIAFLKEKIESLEELTRNEAVADQKEDANERSKSLLTRLIIALCLTLILISFLLFSARNTDIDKKS